MNLKYKSVLALGMSVAMMVQAPVVAFAGDASTDQSGSQDTTSTTTITAGVETKADGFEVYGKEGTNTISSTCGNGYLTYQEQTPTSIGQTIDGASKAFTFGTAYPSSNGSVETTISHVESGDEVKVTYTVTNKSGAPIEGYKVGSAADANINDNDAAQIGFLNEGAGIYMLDDNTGKAFTLLPGENESFDGIWYGAYTYNYYTHVFDNKDRTDAEMQKEDSALAYSWTVDLGTENTNKTVTRTAVFKIGNIELNQISYNPNTGEGVIAGTTVVNGSTKKVVVKTNNGEMTKEGYNFAGWGLSADATSASYHGGEEIDLGTLGSDLRLYALWQLIKTQDPDVTIEEVEEMIQVEETIKEAEPPVSTEGINIISTSAGNALPTTELGNAVAETKTVSLELSKVTPEQYVEVIRNTVQSVPMQGVAVIETNEVATFDRHIIEAMAERPDASYTIVFKDAGVKKKVVIPAGFDVLSLLDENGYCGFLRLAAMLGFTIIE